MSSHGRLNLLTLVFLLLLFSRSYSIRVGDTIGLGYIGNQDSRALPAGVDPDVYARVYHREVITDENGVSYDVTPYMSQVLWNRWKSYWKG
ncbi:unnamed protein product, partial [Mesorhabditis spiculigera]